MGCYVNPEGISKELWLRQYAKQVGQLGEFADDKVPKYSEFLNGTMPVVLVDNGPFTAAGVCYCESEYEAFTDPSDTRSRIIYEVGVEKLKKVSDLENYM